MNVHEQTNRSKLRRWFWLVLFTPAIVSLAGASTGRLVSMFNVNVFIALPLNFICSNWAAKEIVFLHDARGSSSPWMFLWGPLIFFLNVGLVFGGCAVMTAFSK